MIWCNFSRFGKPRTYNSKDFSQSLFSHNAISDIIMHGVTAAMWAYISA